MITINSYLREIQPGYSQTVSPRTSSCHSEIPFKHTATIFPNVISISVLKHEIQKRTWAKSVVITTKMQFRWSCLLPETAIYIHIYHRNLLWSCPWRMHEAVYYNVGLIWQLLPIKSKYFCMKLVRCCLSKSTLSANMIRSILGFIPLANKSKCDFVTRRFINLLAFWLARLVESNYWCQRQSESIL